MVSALLHLINLESSSWNNFQEEVELILRSAVILFDAKAGTIGECIETAIIWSRG